MTIVMSVRFDFFACLLISLGSLVKRFIRNIPRYSHRLTLSLMNVGTDPPWLTSSLAESSMSLPVPGRIMSGAEVDPVLCTRERAVSVKG